MRMWMVNPKILCRQHLLGEHGEIHKHRHCFVRRNSMWKRIEQGQIEPASMESRHDALVVEMLERGYNHDSPYEQPDISYLPIEHQQFVVDTEKTLAELLERCPACLERYVKLDTHLDDK